MQSTLKYKCTRYFKGSLKNDDQDGKLAYILICLDNEELETAYQYLIPRVKVENTIIEFWDRFLEYVKEYSINHQAYIHLLTGIIQRRGESMSIVVTG